MTEIIERGEAAPAVVLVYDYEQLSPDVRHRMMHRACRIKLCGALVVEGMLEIGKLIAEAKEDLQEDEVIWLEWAKTEFGMSRRSVYNYMNSHLSIGPLVQGLAPRQKSELTLEAAYELSRKASAPIREQAVRMLIQGQRVTLKTVKELIHLPEPAEMPKPAKNKKAPEALPARLQLVNLLGSASGLLLHPPEEVAAEVGSERDDTRRRLAVLISWLSRLHGELETSDAREAA